MNTMERKWLAVVTRDPTASVLYGVRTTRIYCRANCPARLARRANVVFFDAPAEAEQAGYRACKRCSPGDCLPEGQGHSQSVARSCEAIALAVREGRILKLSELAKAAGLTPSYYHRLFKRVAGVTPGQYAVACRVTAATATATKTGTVTGTGTGTETETETVFTDDFMDQFVDWNE